MKRISRLFCNLKVTATEVNVKMQPETANSEHSARTGRQDGPPRQALREMPRLSVRHSFSHEASSRRKKIFCLCILCWLMVLCLTGIIIIAVVHFQTSNSEIDQISAGALIGFGLLLIVVLGWSAIIYARFQKRSNPRRDSRPSIPREEILAFASSEIYHRGASTLSTDNSISRSDSSAESTNRRFIYRERQHDDERRAIDPTNTRYVTDPPMLAIHRSTRMMQDFQEHVPGVARPQVLHFPERPRGNTEPTRMLVDPNRATRQFRRHSNPLPPPYQPPIALSHSSSESLPMGFPPPSYDRVFGRRRRCESTASEDSILYPPDYQSSPPSPSPLPTAAATRERRTSLNVPPDPGARIDLGIQISTLSAIGRATSLDSSLCQAHQPSPFPPSGTATRGNVIHHSPSRLSPVPLSVAQVSASALPRYPPPCYRSAAPRYHPSSHSPRSPLHSPVALASHAPERPARGHATPPIFLPNNRSPFSRPILALTSPENTIQESVDYEEESADGNRNETSRSANQEDDQERPNVTLVYLAQSQEEEIIV